MARILVIAAHPDLADSRITKAVLKAARALSTHHDVQVKDLSSG